MSTLQTTSNANQINKLGSSFQNDIAFKQLRIYSQLEANFKAKQWQIQAKISPTYQNIHYDLKPATDDKVNKNYFTISPALSIDKDWANHYSIHARYLHQIFNGLINNIYQGNIVSDYRSISANNQPLPRVIQNNFSLRYTYKKPLKLLFYNLFSSYIRTNSNTINAFTIDSGITKQIAVSYHHIHPLFTIGGGASKYIFLIKTNISGKAFYNRQSGFNYNNGQITPFGMKSYTVNITANKKLFKSANLSIKLLENIVKSKQSPASKSFLKSKFWAQDIICSWQHNMGKNIQYQLYFTTYSTKQGTQPPSRSQFIDFSIQYTPFKGKGYFELECLNLLNEKQYESFNFRSNGYSLLQIPLRERSLLLKYTFTF